LAVSITEIIIIGLIADWLFRRLRIPGLVGMMLVGVLFGPYVLGYLDPNLLAIGADLRLIALIVILLRAGFELNRQTLHRVGIRALLLSVVPAVVEGGVITLLGPRLLGLSYGESAILGAVLAAVSPAVVVPMMIRFIQERRGTEKGIPTMVMAAASVDDVFVIVVYGAILGLYTGQKVHLAWRLASIPLSVVLGIAVGLAVGWGLYKLFLRFNPRATKRVLVVVALAVLLVRMEHLLEAWMPFAALVSAMAIGFVILEKQESMAHEISAKLAKIWVFAEIILFAMVGAEVNIRVAVDAGPAGAVLVLVAVLARAAGTYLCMVRSQLTVGERLFVVIAYTPKATVQAAIGGAPLVAMRLAGMDTGPGEIILAIAVLSILLTAPVGAWMISLVGNRVLKPEELVQAGHTDPETVERDILERLVVADVMDPDPPTAREGDDLTKVLDVFAHYRTSILPVVNKAGALLGLVNLSTLKPIVGAGDRLRWLLAHDLMTPPPAVLRETTRLLEAQQSFEATGAESLPVLEEKTGRLLGLAHHNDLTRTVQETAAKWFAAKQPSPKSETSGRESSQG
jgi:solute carrier family 9B (sodium/hydrogen exchanger), member 1/2